MQVAEYVCVSKEIGTREGSKRHCKTSHHTASLLGVCYLTPWHDLISNYITLLKVLKIIYGKNDIEMDILFNLPLKS